MKRVSFARATRAVCASAMLGALALPAGAADQVSAVNLSPSLGARLDAAADKGPDQLRAFVQRTRMVYALDYADAVKLAEQRRNASRVQPMPFDLAHQRVSDSVTPARVPE